MKKLAISLILMGVAPMAMASSASTMYFNSDNYNNNLLNSGAVESAGPQHIKNASLFPNQRPETQSQDGVDLTSSMFGINGPLSLSSIYSSEYGFIGSAQYTQAFGQDNAGSLLIDAGRGERRINGTWATALSTQQRLKFSAEYLRQYMDFNFLSGQVRKWVGQQAYGLSYQYLLNNQFISAINANSTYSTVRSEGLGGKIMPSDSTQINLRRIAGGTDKSFSGGVNLTPFSSTQLALALDYDQLTYDIKYHNQYQQAKNTSGFGVTANLSQLLSKHIKIQLGGSDRKIYDSYQTEIDYLAHTHPGSELSFGLSAGRTFGGQGLPNDTRVGLNINYSWGGNLDSHPATFSVNTPVNAQNVKADLSQWAATPAVHRAQVLAVADQALVANNNNQLAEHNAAQTTAVIFPVNKSGAEQPHGNVSDVITVTPTAVLGQKAAPISLGKTLNGGLFVDNLPTNSLSVDMKNSYYQSTTDKTNTGSLQDLGISFTTQNGKLALTGTPTKTGTYNIFIYANDSDSTVHHSFVDKADGAQVFTLTVSSDTPTFNQSTITSDSGSMVGVAYSWSLDKDVSDPVGLGNDKNIQLVPVDQNGNPSANAWSQYGFNASSAGSVTITGTPNDAALSAVNSKGELTLYAKLKNAYGTSNTAELLIPVAKSGAPADNKSLDGKHYAVTDGSKTFLSGATNIDFSAAFDNHQGATYTISGLPAGNMQFNSSTGVLQIPQTDGAQMEPGLYSLAVTAKNADGSSQPVNVMLNVTGTMSNPGTLMFIKIENDTKDTFTIQQTYTNNVQGPGFTTTPMPLVAGQSGSTSIQASNTNDPLTQHEIIVNVVAKGQTIPVRLYTPTLKEQCTKGVDGSCPLGFSPISGLPAGQEPTQSAQADGYNFTTSTTINNGEAMATIHVS